MAKDIFEEFDPFKNRNMNKDKEPKVIFLEVFDLLQDFEDKYNESSTVHLVDKYVSKAKKIAEHNKEVDFFDILGEIYKIMLKKLSGKHYKYKIIFDYAIYTHNIKYLKKAIDVITLSDDGKEYLKFFIRNNEIFNKPILSPIKSYAYKKINADTSKEDEKIKVTTVDNISLEEKIQKILESNPMNFVTAYIMWKDIKGEKDAIRYFLLKYPSRMIDILFSKGNVTQGIIKIIQAFNPSTAIEFMIGNKYEIERRTGIKIDKIKIIKMIVSYSINSFGFKNTFEDLKKNHSLEFAIKVFYSLNYRGQLYGLLSEYSDDEIVRILKNALGKKKAFEVIYDKFKNVKALKILNGIFSKEDIYQIVVDKFGADVALKLAKRNNDVPFLYKLIKRINGSPEIIEKIEDEMFLISDDIIKRSINHNGFDKVFLKIKNKMGFKTAVIWMYNAGYKKELLNYLIKNYGELKAFKFAYEYFKEDEFTDLVFSGYDNKAVAFNMLVSFLGTKRDAYIYTFKYLGKDKTFELAKKRKEFALAFRELLRHKLVAPDLDIPVSVLLRSGDSEAYKFALLNKSNEVIDELGLKDTIILANDLGIIDRFIDKMFSTGYVKIIKYAEEILPVNELVTLLLNHDYLYKAIKLLEKNKVDDVGISELLMLKYNDVNLVFSKLSMMWGIERATAAMYMHAEEVFSLLLKSLSQDDVIELIYNVWNLKNNIAKMNEHVRKNILSLLSNKMTLEQYTQFCLSSGVLPDGFKIMFEKDKALAHKMLRYLSHYLKKKDVAELLVKVGMAKEAYVLLTHNGNSDITKTVHIMGRLVSPEKLLKISLETGIGIHTVIDFCNRVMNDKEMIDILIDNGERGIKIALNSLNNVDLKLYERLSERFGAGEAFEIVSQNTNEKHAIKLAVISDYDISTFQYLWSKNKLKTLRLFTDMFGIKRTVSFARRAFSEEEFMNDFITAVIKMNGSSEKILNELATKKYLGHEKVIRSLLAIGGISIFKEHQGVMRFYNNLFNMYLKRSPQNLHKILLPLGPYDWVIRKLIEIREHYDQPLAIHGAITVLSERIKDDKEYMEGLSILVNKYGEDIVSNLLSDKFSFWERHDIFSKYREYVNSKDHRNINILNEPHNNEDAGNSKMSQDEHKRLFKII